MTPRKALSGFEGVHFSQTLHEQRNANVHDQAVFFRRVSPSVSVRVVPFAPDPDETVGQRIMRSIDTLRGAFTEHYDIVHAQDCISANAVPWCTRTIHHLDQFTTPQRADCHEKAITHPVARICVSAAVAAEVQNGWGYSPTVIPNGVDSERFTPEAVDARGRWRQQLGTTFWQSA